MSAAVQTAGPDLQLVDLEARPAHPLATVEQAPRATVGTLAEVTPMQLLQLAVASGDLDRAERFWALVQQVKADAARDAFVEAMAQFKRNPPEIFKTRQANFGKTKGTGAEGASYNYADHASVVLPIAKGLAEHGFSHDWEIEQRDGHVHVTCVVTHRLGHSKRVHMYASPDNSGSKNGVQAIASTSSYLQRYTLLAATGMSTQQMGDDDGAGGPPAANDASAGRTDPPFDGPYYADERDQRTAAPAPAAPAGNFYSAEEFAAKSPDWIEKIKTGGDRNHPDRLIPFVESRGKKFTDDQKKTLRAVKAA